METAAQQEEKYAGFYQLCRMAEMIFEEDWRDTDEKAKTQKLEREKRAIMGYERERIFFQSRIGDIIRERGWQAEVPPWYGSLEEGIFHEVYGLAGLAPWAYDTDEKYRNSSSAKLIGERMYCLIGGVSRLQPQRFSARRREQLKRALLLASPRERLEEGFHEVYLQNGIRITIFSGERTKEGQDVMVFRKYILQQLTFEELARLRTIPADAIPLFHSMIRLGLNILIAGPVRSGKTTFLQVWQKQEDDTLEGLAISTDPETPWHELMPDAPIMQLVADGKELDTVMKSLLRGDNDYILLEEMRDAAAFRLALAITSAGTMRSKATIHSSDAVQIPYKMASAICEAYGGNQQNLIARVFQNFQLVFLFRQLPADRAEKRLAEISAYTYDAENDAAAVHTICRYIPSESQWRWNAAVPWQHLRSSAMTQKEEEEWEKMQNLLEKLEKRNPIMGKCTIYPRYYRPDSKEGGPK
ncbi:MAG: Flp pilus assembly complex ATPase component TadA [Firmicutes bacterium]|nr:Flp pilus assembly complex ATPase component TadA [Bacillota bacterium]